MNNKDDIPNINASLDKIKISNDKKKQVYYSIRRDFDKKGYVSNKKLHFFKQKFDRFVPAVAVLLIIFCGFTYYGVSSGLFTGQPFVPTDKMLADAGYGGESTASSTAAESADAQAATGRGTADGAAPAENQAKFSVENGELPNTVSVNANIYASLDVGYTLYVVNNIPHDALVLWQEMAELKAVPADISLESYSITEDVLTLEFNDRLQAIQNASATTALAAGITKTYSEFYPEVTQIALTSAGNPLTFKGGAVEIPIDTVLDVTDRKEVEYTPYS